MEESITTDDISGVLLAGEGRVDLYELYDFFAKHRFDKQLRLMVPGHSVETIQANAEFEVVESRYRTGYRAHENYV